MPPHPPAVLVWSIPLSRYNHSAEMVPELLAVGGALAQQLEALDLRVLVLVSSDLAHTHRCAACPHEFTSRCGFPFVANSACPPALFALFPLNMV